MIRKIWKFKNESVTAQMVREAANSEGVMPLMANILLNRNIEPENFRQFLSKSKQGIINPLSMLDMEKAAERIKTAVEK